MAEQASILHQPKAVWAIAFACMVSFMGIGLVDPILPAISRELEATPSQTMLLFTSYLFITGIAMLFTGWLSSRIGIKKTLMTGLILIVLFSALAGASANVSQIIGYRAGWGLGNALFISTALAAIVGAATGGSKQAVILYEAALGVGMAVGPLAGGVLGSISWRAPFFGTAVLMFIGLLAIVLVYPKEAATLRRDPQEFWAGLKAMKNPALRHLAFTSLFYNFAFFVLLAYSPYPLEAAAKHQGIEFGAHELGYVFFGWGLLLALSSVLLAPRMTRSLGLKKVLLSMFVCLAVLMAICAIFYNNLAVLIVAVVFSGLFQGVLNTSLTETVMEATDLPRAVASSTYSGVRFMGGAIAPVVAGPIAAAINGGTPYWLAVASIAVSVLLLLVSAHATPRIEERPHETAEEEAEDIRMGVD